MLTTDELKDKVLVALQRDRISKPRHFAHLEHTAKPQNQNFESRFPYRSTMRNLECSLPIWDLCMQNRYSLENAVSGADLREAEILRQEFTQGTYAKYLKRAK